MQPQEAHRTCLLILAVTAPFGTEYTYVNKKRTYPHLLVHVLEANQSGIQIGIQFNRLNKVNSSLE